MKRLLLVSALILPVVVAGCGEGDGAEITAATEASASITVQRTEGISYALKDDDSPFDSDDLLDVYAPEESGPWPVVIIAHGHSQTEHAFRPLAEAIAAEGAVVLNIDYDDALPSLAGIEDVACAVRFARANAADYGGDPTRITLIGNSQGAVSGMIVGLNGDAHTRDCVTSEGSALVDAVVAYEGDYDWAESFFYQLRDANPTLWEAIDPHTYIGGNPDLVVRLIHGEGGEIVPQVPQIVSVEFSQVLADAGYDVELSLVEQSPHTALTDSSTPAFAAVIQQVMEVAGG